MKDLKSLIGAKILSKTEQQSVKGGHPVEGECYRNEDCDEGYFCMDTACFRIR